MRFWKMNGAGNDFLILNNLEERLPPEALPRIARTLCQRHMSIGADGLMAVEAADQGGDFKMLFFNSDGSMGEMCGNGARCVCRFGYEQGLAGEVQRVETTAGLVTGARIDRRTYRVRLNTPSVVELDRTVSVDGTGWPCAYVELGNPGVPHAVVQMEGLRTRLQEELRELGRKLRGHSTFPKGANVNFYEPCGTDAVYLRTYERGVEDFTYACGTGAGSTVTVLTLQGAVSGRSVRVATDGGVLVIDAERRGDGIEALFLTGPTNTVARGTVTDESLFP